jgi:hypothetical protein
MSLRAVLRQSSQVARWAATAPATAAPVRSLRTMTFGSEKEDVVERSDYPVDKIQKVRACASPNTLLFVAMLQHYHPHAPCVLGTRLSAVASARPSHR